MSKAYYQSTRQKVRETHTISGLEVIERQIRRLFSLGKLTEKEFLKLDDIVFGKIVKIESNECED